MGRKKVLKQRVYTFRQLWKKRLGSGAGPLRLYGAVQVTGNSAFNGPAELGIRYIPKDTDHNFPIAAVYRAANNATLYVMYGIGQKRNQPEMRQKIARWMRYAPAFTPMPPGERLYEGQRRFFLRQEDGSTSELPDMPGVWTKYPLVNQRLADWTDAGFATYPLFARRARRFARMLREEVSPLGGELRLQELSVIRAADKRYHDQPGLSLELALPPSASRHGRVLGIEVFMYDREARQHHRVDGDYGMKNCHFLACPAPVHHYSGPQLRKLMRWKCAKDAIIGIKEWILGDLYIPGPG